MDDDAPLEYLATPDPGRGPVASAATLAGIVARHRRRRTRALGAALAVAVVAGPAVGFAAGRSGRDGGGRTVSAADGGDPQVPSTRVDAASAVAVPGMAMAPAMPPDRPKGTRVFVRDTADGIRVRAYVMAFSKGDPSGGSGVPAACAPTALFQAEVSDDLVAGSDGSGFVFGSEPSVASVVSSMGLGDMESDPISVVSARTASGVARLKVTFPDGTSDEMAPVDGWAVLAHHAPGGLREGGSLVAFDAGGSVLATVDLAQPPFGLPEACKPPPPILSDGPAPAASFAGPPSPPVTATVLIPPPIPPTTAP